MLKKEELNRISETIRNAESHTSGEIRVYLARSCKGDPLETAIRLFHKLKMDSTELRNGVLIYVSPSDHKTAIYGDSGINKATDDHMFWQDAINIMLPLFKEDLIAEGICEGVTKAGALIKEHFPVSANDLNELNNEVIVEE